MIELQLEEDFRTRANSSLRDAEAQLAELVQRRAIAKDRLEQATVRAPQSGTVQQLAFTR